MRTSSSQAPDVRSPGCASTKFERRRPHVGKDVRAAGPTDNFRSAATTMSLLPPLRPCSPKPNEITATGGAHRRERARCGPDRSEPGPANSPPDNSVRGRLKCVAGSDFALKARPERRHLCPHPTIAIASTVAPRLFANGEVSRNVQLLRSRQLRPRGSSAVAMLKVQY